MVTASLLAVIPNTVYTIAGVLTGWNSDRTKDRIYHGVFGNVLAAVTTGFTGILIGIHANTSAFQIVTLSLAQAGQSIFYVVFLGLQGETIPKNSAASAFSIIKTAGLVGGILGPYMLGKMKESLGSFSAPMYILSVFFALTGILFFQMRLFLRMRSETVPAIALSVREGSKIDGSYDEMSHILAPLGDESA